MNQKMDFNPETGQALKEFRMQHKIKAKDVASILDKSPAYISKLEKGQIQQIPIEDFIKITNFITKDEDGYDQFCNFMLSKVTRKELEEGIFWTNFDEVVRRIPITKELIYAVKEKMNTLNITEEELTEYINQNEDLTEQFYTERNIDLEKVEKNIWHAYYDEKNMDYIGSYFIFDIKTKTVKEALSGHLKKSSYMLMFGIVYHLFKLEKKSNGEAIDEKCQRACRDLAEQFLLSYKFYTVWMETKVKSQSSNEEEYNKLLSDFDLKNKEYVTELLDAIDFLSKLDIDYTNEKLRVIIDNFKGGDETFVLAFMAISLKDIQELQTATKRQFLSDIKTLIKEYKEKANTKEMVEKY